MTTLLARLALSLAVALPAAFAVENTGLALPAALAPTTLAGVFAATFVLLLAFADYGPRRTLHAIHPIPRHPAAGAATVSGARATYPLAA